MKLRIVRVNQCYRIERWMPWMAKPLTGHRVELRKKESSFEFSRKMEPVKVSCPCYLKNEVTGEALFYAGLLDKFQAEAAAQGYELEVIDGRDQTQQTLVQVM